VRRVALAFDVNIGHGFFDFREVCFTETGLGGSDILFESVLLGRARAT
jgi:hypothetical protein